MKVVLFCILNAIVQGMKSIEKHLTIVFEKIKELLVMYVKFYVKRSDLSLIEQVLSLIKLVQKWSTL